MSRAPLAIDSDSEEELSGSSAEYLFRVLYAGASEPGKSAGGVAALADSTIITFIDYRPRRRKI